MALTDLHAAGEGTAEPAHDPSRARSPRRAKRRRCTVCSHRIGKVGNPGHCRGCGFAFGEGTWISLARASTTPPPDERTAAEHRAEPAYDPLYDAAAAGRRTRARRLAPACAKEQARRRGQGG